MHDLFMGHIAVGEDDLVDILGSAEFFELRFVDNRNSVRIQGAGQGRGIAPPGNARDLARREGDHPGSRVFAVHDIEIVKVASGCPQEDNPA